MKRKFLHMMIAILALISTSFSSASDYIIYSISQDLPMGNKNETLRKNYYVNFGENQGLSNGAKVDVFRTISRLNPLDSNKRYNYKVKIGELEIVHAEKEISIGQLNTLRNDDKTPYFEIKDFMIGDKVEVSVNN